MEENSGSQSVSTKEGCRATVHCGSGVIPVPCPTATEDVHFKQVAQDIQEFRGHIFCLRKRCTVVAVESEKDWQRFGGR